MAVIPSYERVENPLKIMRTTRYIKIEDVWYLLSIEVDQNIEVTTAFKPATGRTLEMLQSVGDSEIQTGLESGTILGML